MEHKGWLIERNDAPIWWAPMGWTTDSLVAIRSATYTEAADFMSANDITDAHPTEHIWSDNAGFARYSRKLSVQDHQASHGERLVIVDDKARILAYVDPSDRMEAGFMCHAVNAYDSLYAACKGVDEAARNHGRDGDIVVPSHIWDMISQAIDIAEGQ